MPPFKKRKGAYSFKSVFKCPTSSLTNLRLTNSGVGICSLGLMKYHSAHFVSAGYLFETSVYRGKKKIMMKLVLMPPGKRRGGPPKKCLLGPTFRWRLLDEYSRVGESAYRRNEIQDKKDVISSVREKDTRRKKDKRRHRDRKRYREERRQRNRETERPTGRAREKQRQRHMNREGKCW